MTASVMTTRARSQRGHAATVTEWGVLSSVVAPRSLASPDFMGTV